MKPHRWSGWPGAFCLDCGCEDPFEIALADGDFLEVADDSAMGFHYEFPNVVEADCVGRNMTATEILAIKPKSLSGWIK